MSTMPDRRCEIQQALADLSAEISRWCESCDCFKVRSHYIGNPADFCVFPEIIKFALAATTTFAQCLDCNIETDLVAVLEAIGDSLRRTIQSHGHAVDLVGVNTRIESCFGESHYPKSGVINTRSSGFSIKRDPNLERTLSPNFVETKCRE